MDAPTRKAIVQKAIIAQQRLVVVKRCHAHQENMEIQLVNQLKHPLVHHHAHQENMEMYLDKQQLETHALPHAQVGDTELQQVKPMKVKLVGLHAGVVDGVQQQVKPLKLVLAQTDARQENTVTLRVAHPLKIRVYTIVRLEDTHHL